MDRSYFAATGMISFAYGGHPSSAMICCSSVSPPRQQPTHGKVASEFADPGLFLGQLERRPAYFGGRGITARLRREGAERLASRRTSGEAGKHPEAWGVR